MGQSLEQSAPPQGERAWQSLPARGTQPVPAWLPRLPTFPRCHPPRSTPGQCPRLLAQVRDTISPSPLCAQALGVTHYKQSRSSRKSKHGIRATRTHLLSGFFQSWEDWTLRHPGSQQLLCLTIAPRRWDKISACSTRGSIGVPPAPVLTLPEGGAAELGDCGFPTFLLELLMVLSYTPLLGSMELHPSHTPHRQASPTPPLCRHLL